jgi:hypothetical protein
MAKVRYTGGGRVQTGTSPEDTRTWGGEEGQVEEVPSDIAKALVAAGFAEPAKAAKS